ncbi:MAG: PTS system mannose/fructose/sorbose family transporter subunit IID [Lachnospiraceae bacterium]|nr:PTS system mannose/fructose/sorbose family transporter subunit IID [Lachnospiraceae bacterium]
MAEEKRLLTEKDVKKSWLLYYFFAETGISYERLQALGLTMSLIPILKKLYPDKKDFAAALKRHMTFYNTEAVFGSVINGITIAMEEQKSLGAPIDDETITSIKSGLMGPMAGVGDSLDWATFKPIIFALGATLSASGNPLGCFVLLLLPIIQVIIGTNLSAFGYRAGRSSVKSLLGSGKIQQLLTAASALGIFMMGALSSTYVKLSTPLEFTFGKGNDPWVVQNILDGIVPGILPLAAVLGVYWWLTKKNQNMVAIMLIILAISLVGAFVGIF